MIHCVDGYWQMDRNYFKEGYEHFLNPKFTCFWLIDIIKTLHEANLSTLALSLLSAHQIDLKDPDIEAVYGNILIKTNPIKAFFYFVSLKLIQRKKKNMSKILTIFEEYVQSHHQSHLKNLLMQLPISTIEETYINNHLTLCQSENKGMIYYKSEK